jgi:hypothetical protein
MYDGNGSPAEQWTLVDDGDGDGYYHLVNGVASDRCLGIYGGDIANNPVDLWPCDVNDHNQSNQLWKPVHQADGSYAIESKAGLVLSLPTGTATSNETLIAAPEGQPGTTTWNFVPLTAW